MTRKANPSRTIRYFGRRLIVSLLAGGVFLTLLGSIVAIVASVSQRYKSPEDGLAELLWQTEPHGRYNPDHQPEISQIELIHRQALDEMNAIHFVYRWQIDYNGQISYCEGGVLVQQFQDIFGGWQELGHAMSGCGSRYFGSSSTVTFWESMPWEYPHYYTFYAFGREPVAAQVEVILGDGSSESVETVDSRYALVVQREAPFQVKHFKYIADAGMVLKIERYRN